MEEKTTVSKRKKVIGFIVGLVIMIFAVFGVLGLVSVGISAIRQGKEEKLQQQYAEYNEFLIPAAAIDIQPFDDITHAAMSELVEMSVWSILNSDLDPAAYNYSDGRLVIPAAQVKAEFERYFGTDVPIVHCTVEGYGYEFTYDATNGVYYIPLTTITPIYTPRVTSTEKKGSSVTVTCGLSNASLWTQNKLTGEMNAPQPDKYIKVTLRTIGKTMYISAIQSSSTPEVAGTSAPAASEAEGEITLAPAAETTEAAEEESAGETSETEEDAATETKEEG